jgi:prephenate dehydratase
MKIAYLGPEGSFSHIALQNIANTLFEEPFLYVSMNSFTEAVNELRRGSVEYALLPIENSLGGSVPESLDQISSLDGSFQVQLEWVASIEHCLSGFQKDFSKVKEVRAHFQALAQCREFLKFNLPKAELKEMPSNSTAVKSLHGITDALAICSLEAAELYNVPLIEKGINDLKDNFTRFWLVGTKSIKLISSTGQKLTSIVFRIPLDEPGGLVRVLKVLSDKKINLTKIESRPTRGRLCEYSFFIDFIYASEKKEIFDELKNVCAHFKHLGTYEIHPKLDLRFTSNPSQG